MTKKMMLISAVLFFSTSVFAQSYKYDLKAIKKRSKKQIGIIQEKLKEQREQKRQDEKAAEIDAIFNQAEDLYQKGDFKKAKELYEKAYKLSDDKSMRGYIVRANKEIAKQKLQERDYQRQLKTKQKQIERQEKIQQSQLTKEQKKQKRLEAKKEKHQEKRSKARRGKITKILRLEEKKFKAKLKKD